MAKIMTIKNITKEIDIDGSEHSTICEQTKKVEMSTEPDYIKIYTRMWFEFNQIPKALQPLFLELIANMTYCNAYDLKNSQIVCTSGPIGEMIVKNLNISKRHFLRCLKELSEYGAIKKVKRGFYQINPNYAGKGEWKYNPKLERGGIEKLVATFNFNTKDINLNVLWSDCPSVDEKVNKDMREEFGRNSTLYEESIN